MDPADLLEMIPWHMYICSNDSFSAFPVPQATINQERESF